MIRVRRPPQHERRRATPRPRRAADTAMQYPIAPRRAAAAKRADLHARRPGRARLVLLGAAGARGSAARGACTRGRVSPRSLRRTPSRARTVRSWRCVSPVAARPAPACRLTAADEHQLHAPAWCRRRRFRRRRRLDSRLGRRWRLWLPAAARH